MTDTNVQTTQVLYPALRYTDAHAAIDWLVAAFGSERQVVYKGPDNTVAHAQITLDGAVLMLGSAREGGVYPGKTPAQLGGITGSLYVYVTDPDAHCARAHRRRSNRDGTVRHRVRLARIRRLRPRGLLVDIRNVPSVDCR
jgi:hypothetical protein